jgi:cyclopropane-fatty-acyl-phospholipid synthase
MSTLTVAQPLCLRHPVLRPLCVRARIARLVVDRMLDQVPVRAIYPDGTVRGGGGPDAPVVRIIRPDAMFERLAHNPKIGLGEAYTAGDWTAADGTDLADLLTPFAARVSRLVPHWLLRFRRVLDRRIPHRLRNTPSGARDNTTSATRCSPHSWIPA